TDSEDALPLNVESDSIDPMCHTYRLIRVAIPNVATTAQEKCATAIEAAFDLTRLRKRSLGANVGPQLPGKDVFRPPILDSYKRSTDCCDLGNVFAGQCGISCMYRSDSKRDGSQHGEHQKGGTREHLTRIRRQFVVYFCLHRGKFAGKYGKLASPL